MFQLWCDNVNLATRGDLQDAEQDAQYMANLWETNIGIWYCDGDGDHFIKLIEQQ